MDFIYPNVRRDEVRDDYHGTSIADPYRWLEDVDSEETEKFIQEQTALTTQYLDSCSARKKIEENVTDMINHERYSTPQRHGNRYFYSMNTGLQEQDVIYLLESLQSEPKVLLDPNICLPEKGEAVTFYKFSEDGETLAYCVMHKGSEWNTVRFRDVNTCTDYPDSLETVRYSNLAWTTDSKGIFYTCFPDYLGYTKGKETQDIINSKLYYHKLNTQQKDDLLIAEFPEAPHRHLLGYLSPCGRWLIVTAQEGRALVLAYFCDLQENRCSCFSKGKVPLTPIQTRAESVYHYVSNNGTIGIFLTNDDSPNYSIVTIDFMDPRSENYKTLVPERNEEILEYACHVYHDKLILCYLRNVVNVLEVHDINAGDMLKTIPLEHGSILDISGNVNNSEIFFNFKSMTCPGTLYRCDVSEDDIEPTVFRQTPSTCFHEDAYQCNEVFYTSYDLTKVPMFILHKKSFEKDGNAPCLLHGYGAFSESIKPVMRCLPLVFINMFNGVFAVANVRGGGEYGASWHNMGRMYSKQNSFNDFQAAAEYLVKEKYTNSKKLAIRGASNGGLLVAVCMNQRPELFAAGIVQKGLLDMLRYHLFTIGRQASTEYGTSEDQRQFQNLTKYSPLHNIREPPDDVQFPATLVWTGDHDTIVIPAHSFKYIATLQHTMGASSKQTNPLLLFVEEGAGHSIMKPTLMRIQQDISLLCFLKNSMNLEVVE